MTEVLFRGAGPARQVQREIELKVLEPEERALSVAGDCFLSARAASGSVRLWLVRLGVEELAKHFPAQVKNAQRGQP